MDNNVRYTLVGVFLVVFTVALFVFFFWLAGDKSDKVYKIYLTYMSEGVTGLQVQSPVRYNGVPVGYVDSIKLDPQNPQLVQIRLQIEEGAPVTTATVASLNSQGVTGVVYLGLKTTSPRAPNLTALKGQKFPVIPSRPSFLLQLSSVLPQITENIQKISNNFSRVLDAENRAAIRGSLKNIDTFTQGLANSSGNLQASIVSLKKTLNNTAVASQDLPAVLTQLTKILTRTAVISKHISKASKSVVSTANDLHVTMENVSQQVVPNFSQLMLRLNTLTVKLDAVSKQLERNPAMFIRGRVPQAPGPGEVKK